MYERTLGTLIQLVTPAAARMAALTLLSTLLLVTGAAAEPRMSSDLLLPYFEVDLSGFGLSTVFHVTNSSDKEVAVRIGVYSNWGIPLLEVELPFEEEETRAFNLRDWLLLGRLPDGRILGDEELDHLRAALTGEVSPRDAHYYGSAVRPDLAVGYVTLRGEGFPPTDELWGNYYVIDSDGNAAQGDVLVDIEAGRVCGRGLCLRHRLFFLEGSVFDGGTQLIVWTGHRGAPTLDSAASQAFGGLDSRARDMDGTPMGEHYDSLLATRTLSLADLALPEAFGTLDLMTLEEDGETPMESFVGIRYTAGDRYSVGLQTFCQPFRRLTQETPRIRIEKATNGEDADVPTGPVVAVGSAVFWTYVVTNTGDVDLSDVTVVDDNLGAIACPKSSLAPGESMTCTAQGIAVAGQYRNESWARGTSPDGNEVEDHDPSHYLGEEDHPAIDVEKATNGEDADVPTGPVVAVGSTVVWTYVVTNTGDVDLSDVAVEDDKLGPIACPKSTLAPGESMTCTAQGIAAAGQYRNESWARGTSPDGNEVEDHDPSHYFGEEHHPAIDVEKATNGEDADVPTGPVVAVGSTVIWTYVVTNTGDVDLSDVTVEDDKLGAISCPKSSLAPGESMTCTAQGIAEAGQYRNESWTRGTSPDGSEVEDHDPSHYFGERFAGRMTGGGSVFDGEERFTHGFELHCDTSEPNNLEINWGVGNRFHLTNLVFAACSDDPGIDERPPAAGFDTFEGTGTGRLNGVEGATIRFVFTDAGEPGKSVDLAEFRIVPPGGGPAIEVSGFLEKGNHQAHRN